MKKVYLYISRIQNVALFTISKIKNNYISPSLSNDSFFIVTISTVKVSLRCDIEHLRLFVDDELCF